MSINPNFVNRLEGLFWQFSDFRKRQLRQPKIFEHDDLEENKPGDMPFENFVREMENKVILSGDVKGGRWESKMIGRDHKERTTTAQVVGDWKDDRPTFFFHHSFGLFNPLPILKGGLGIFTGQLENYNLISVRAQFHTDWLSLIYGNFDAYFPIVAAADVVKVFNGPGFESMTDNPKRRNNLARYNSVFLHKPPQARESNNVFPVVAEHDRIVESIDQLCFWENRLDEALILPYGHLSILFAPRIIREFVAKKVAVIEAREIN